VIDVTGPAATDVTDDVLPADDVTFVHVSDVRRLLTSVEPESAAELSPALPVVVYVGANETAPGRVLLQLMPSVNSLQGNEACRLGSTDQNIRQTFAVEQKDALSSVLFRRAISSNKPQRYQLSIICEQIVDTTSQQPFMVYLHVHLL